MLNIDIIYISNIHLCETNSFSINIDLKTSVI